ncbi:hypothetical protein ABIE33_006692 [Ensifer sp. 4252]
MDQSPTDAFSDHDIKFIPPQGDLGRERNTATCLCCQKKHRASKMDVDGCGICEECLAA